MTVRRQGRPAGGSSRLGMPLLAPGFTSSRNTVSTSSVMASPRGVKMRRAWVVRSSVPVLPSRTCRSFSSVSRRKPVADQDGAWNVKREPAYMRRGSGIFGSTPAPVGRPSAARVAVGAVDRK